jgi:hypothetical protein
MQESGDDRAAFMDNTIGLQFDSESDGVGRGATTLVSSLGKNNFSNLARYQLTHLAGSYSGGELSCPENYVCRFMPVPV